MLRGFLKEADSLSWGEVDCCIRGLLHNHCVDTKRGPRGAYGTSHAKVYGRMCVRSCDSILQFFLSNRDEVTARFLRTKIRAVFRVKLFG